MKFVRLLFIFLFVFQFSFGQTWQDTLSLIDKNFSQYLAENPGCQLSISRNGQIIFSKAWGTADLERHVPIKLSNAYLNSIAGMYLNERNHSTFHLTAKEIH